jgi:hypothetical protein
MNKRTIDPERLAAFLDGRLDAAARAAVVEELSHADSETLIAFGDAASIVRESAQPTLSARPWSRRTVLVGTTVLAAAAVFAAVMLPRYLGRSDVDGQTSAHYATLLDSVAVRAQPARVLVFRGAVGLSTPTGLAVASVPTFASATPLPGKVKYANATVVAPRAATTVTSKIRSLNGSRPRCLRAVRAGRTVWSTSRGGMKSFQPRPLTSEHSRDT